MPEVVNNSKPIGNYLLFDKRSVMELLPFIALANEKSSTLSSTNMLNENPCGLIVAGTDDKISHISAEAREALYWANQGNYIPGATSLTSYENLSLQVKWLRLRLRLRLEKYRKLRIGVLLMIQPVFFT